jgi:hypothetical protein
MFRVKRGPVLLWTVTTVVARTNDRVNGIAGGNPIVIRPYFNIAAFEVKVTALVNLPLTDVRIYGSFTGTAASTTIGFPPVNSTSQSFALPIGGSAPTLAAGEATLMAGLIPTGLAAPQRPGQVGVVPPALLLEYTTGAAGATPNLVFEVRAFFVGSPFYAVDP